MLPRPTGCGRRRRSRRCSPPATARSRPTWSGPSPRPSSRRTATAMGRSLKSAKDVLECLRTHPLGLVHGGRRTSRTTARRMPTCSSRMSCTWLKTDEHALAGGLAAKLSEAEGRAIKLLTPPKTDRADPADQAAPARSRARSGRRSAPARRIGWPRRTGQRPPRNCTRSWRRTHATGSRSNGRWRRGRNERRQPSARSSCGRSSRTSGSGTRTPSPWACTSPTAWRGPNEVEFDFGKAQVVRADTVFQVRAGVAGRRDGSKGRIILLTKLQQADLGQRCGRPAGPQPPVRHRPLGQPVRPVQGQGTRPLDLRPGHRPGPARVRPARRLPARVGGHPRRRDGLAGHQPPRLRHGRERAGPRLAAALGDGEVRPGPLPRRAAENCGPACGSG